MSRKWNQDPFTKKARNENYLARSVYKLQELDAKFQLIKKAQKILDLGASPGSWSQYCLKKNKVAQIVAIDIKPIDLEDARLTKILGSIEDFDSLYQGESDFDLILSDMAPKTTGMHDLDVHQSFELGALALEQCRTKLKKGGSFVVKLFMGEPLDEFLKEMKLIFGKTGQLRPKSTRKQSREIFVVGKDKLS